LARNLASPFALVANLRLGLQQEVWLVLSCWHTLANVREYVQVMCALVLNILMVLFNEATLTFHFLHPSIKVDLPPFVNDFHSKTKVALDQKTFISVLAHSPCLSYVGPLNMVYELLQYYFILDDFTSGFELFF
jgi:hypothetical protein